MVAVGVASALIKGASFGVKSSKKKAAKQQAEMEAQHRQHMLIIGSGTSSIILSINFAMFLLIFIILIIMTIKNNNK